MKLRKSILSMLICLAMILSGILIFPTEVSAAELTGAEITEEEFARLVKDQEAAVNANEILMESFLVDEVIVYPDEYAGTYIEDNKLIIELTCDDESIIQKYETLLEDFDCIEYRIVEYSYNFLYDLANETAGQLLNDYPVTMFYVDVLDNCVCIEIADNKELEAEMQYSRMRDSHSDCISFKPGAYAQTQTWDLFAGCGINNGSSGFTLGFWGTYQGKKVIVTCGHDLKMGMKIYYNGDILGTVIVNRFWERGSGDFSIVEVTGDFAPLYRTERRWLEGILFSPAVGTYVYKDGNKAIAYCQVDSTNATVYTVYGDGLNGYSVTNMVNAVILSGSSKKGDSGAPVHTGSMLCGFHSSYNERDNTIAFTPYATVRAIGFHTIWD